MTDRTETLRIARWTGAAYLGIVIAGLFAELVVRGALIVPGDASATAARIAGSPGLFGLGIGADLLMVALDIGVAFGLYRLLRDVDRRLALVATGLRLVQSSIIAVNLLNLTSALSLARRASAEPALAALALEKLEAHALTYDVGLIAFGLACLVLSPLVRRAGAPRLLALGLGATGIVYLVGSFAALFAPGASSAIDPFYGIAIIVEPAVAIWLLRGGGAVAASGAMTARPWTTPLEPQSHSSR